MYKLKKLKPVTGYGLKAEATYCDCHGTSIVKIPKQIYFTEDAREDALTKFIEQHSTACSFNYKKSCKIIYYE